MHPCQAGVVSCDLPKRAVVSFDEMVQLGAHVTVPLGVVIVEVTLPLFVSYEEKKRSDS